MSCPFVACSKRVLALAVFLLPTAAFAQDAPAWLYNVDASGVAIGGYDVVAYFHADRATRGSDRFEARHHGVTYHFASAENRDAFRADPERYLPVCGGWDALFCGVDPANAGFAPSRWRPSPEAFRIAEGRLALLSDRPSGNSLAAVDRLEDLAPLLERADAFWRDRAERARALGGKPDGMHPQARLELADWLPLLGSWRCEGFVLANPTAEEYRSIGTATWTFMFGFDGMMILDHWMPDDNPVASGPALRGYDSLNQVWKMMFVPVNGPPSQDWHMTGRWVDGELHADLSVNDGQTLGKVRFYEIGDTSFRWRSSRSFDAGENWIEDFQYTDCSRSSVASYRDGTRPAARAASTAPAQPRS